MAEKGEYRKWLEYRWTSPDVDWQKGDIITCGIDIGSVSSQAVIMVDGKLYAYASMRTGSNSPDSAHKALNKALEGTGLTEDKLQYVVGTGYGRVNVPMAKRAITEIACHALGANFIFGPSVRTVLDVGGQDCKIIRVDEKGKAVSFMMNDKCAAGTGRGMEVMAELLNVPITEIGERSFDVKEEPEPVNTTCVVYAKSEAVSLLRKGWQVNEVLAAYNRAMANRVYELIERLGVEKEFVITGGQSKNMGLVKRLEKLMGIKGLSPGDLDAQIAGGIGAALFAKAIVEKSRNTPK
ncbi:benzoyl-CoA reductase, bzd-type, subunit Q [Chloroflexota bacterium]